MKFVVFTDLDATLLDPVTYEWRPAQDAISALKMLNGSLVLVSSKTCAEMAPLHQELGFNDPFIVENGGGISLNENAPQLLTQCLRTKIGQPIVSHGSLLFSLGTQYNELTAALKGMELELGRGLQGFARMSTTEISLLTGLSGEEADRAKARCFDEPFLASDELGDGNALKEAARRRGLTAVQGGRFWHLLGHAGKGEAVRLLIQSYQDTCGPVLTVGLGDSPNDFPFLEIVDIPVLLGASDAGPSVPPALAGIRKNPKAGPEGWREAVLDILEEMHARGAE